MGFASKGIICSCAAGIKTGLTAEPWHAPLHLNSPPRRISVVRGTKTGKANPVQHSQSCQITHTMLGSLYWAQPAQRSILDMHSLFKVHWHSRGDKCRWMQSDDHWECAAIVAWNMSSALIFWYKRCDSCPLSNRHGMHWALRCTGSGLYHCGPFGKHERSTWNRFERWVIAVWD